MTNRETEKNKLVELVTGQLTAREAHALRQRAKADPALVRELQRLTLLWSALPKTAKAEVSVALWDRLFEETIAQNPKQARPEKSYVSRPLVPFWIPASAISLLGIGITLFQPLVYQAPGRVLLSPKDKTTSLSDVALATRNSVELFRSSPVKRSASEHMTNGRSLTSYSVTPVEATTILEIIAEGDNPTAVAEEANAIMEAGIAKLESPLQGKIIESAVVPGAPVRPNKPANITFAVLLGCAIGGLLQIFRRS
ncbi:hypothetical protein [Armatimonas sp.]|uniref:hypothetical protein n=1 Tax=Armatimonas sp. TaxID=1872638 RepID=UPI0037531AC8